MYRQVLNYTKGAIKTARFNLNRGCLCEVVCVERCDFRLSILEGAWFPQPSERLKTNPLPFFYTTAPTRDLSLLLWSNNCAITVCSLYWPAISSYRSLATMRAAARSDDLSISMAAVLCRQALSTHIAGGQFTIKSYKCSRYDVMLVSQVV